MRKGIVINVYTDKGRKALIKHLQDKRTEGLKNRLLYRQAFEERKTYKDGELDSLIIIPKHRYISADAAIPIAHDMMNANGAGRHGQDFSIGVYEVNEVKQ